MDNPFAIFSLAPTFVLDEPQLAVTFRQLQRAVHPDRYAGASDQERRRAVEQAAAVNDAYHILRDPVRRASCLLSLQGMAIQEADHTLMDPAFLMEQMELRERLAAVHDTSHPLQVLAELMEILRQRRAALLEELAKYLSDATRESLTQAVEIIRRLRFFDRLVAAAMLAEERYLDLIPT